MFNVAICDDEKTFLNWESRLIKKYMKYNQYSCVVDTYQSGKELLNIKDNIRKYDIIFLDIDMEDVNGIETAKQIRVFSNDIYIAFVTAFINYSLEGYKVNAVRYIMKDESTLQKSIFECLDAVLLKKSYREYTCEFNFKEGRKRIHIGNIVYIESQLHRLYFHVCINDEMKEYTISAKLDEMDDRLKDFNFLRIHKSCLVNLRYVKSVERYTVYLFDGKGLSISQSRYKVVKEEFLNYCGDI